MPEQENKIYVGNLSYESTEDGIKKFFADNGVDAKSVEIIKDKFSGRSKGFGFITVESDEMVEKAIEALDGQELDGRKLKINRAKKPEVRERFDSRDGRPSM